MFNGKELDEETGLYYYGARYYDARTSVFISIDPLSDDYSFQTPYAYAVNNPIKYMDIMGMGPGDGVDPVTTPRIRPTSGSLNKSRFQMVNRINPDGSVRKHHGVDILAVKGTSLKSVLGGEIVGVRNSFKPGEYAEDSYGNYIIVKSVVDGENVFIKYAHLDEVKVIAGKVEAGQEIGLTGNTGNAVGLPDAEDHVHIEASKGGNKFMLNNRLDPEQFFESKFDRNGNPINPSSFTDSEIGDILNYLIKIDNENFIGPPLPASTNTVPVVE